MIGKILGNRYEIMEVVGIGGMSVVYRARCRLLNRMVAVKVLKDEYKDDKEFIKRFNIESQAAASLSHQNIISIFDVGHEGDNHYIVMEYIEGQTLKQYIEKNGMLEWKQAVDFAIQICSALEHAHKNNIIHRDIKPQNILMTKDGVLKVTDFGIARAVNSQTIAMDGTALGSVHYISPEQARGSYIDEKSDLYSLGVVLYEMLAGTLPFDGDNPVAIAIKHIQQQPRSIKDFNIAVPLALEQIVKKAMQKSSSDRYVSASDILKDLKKTKDAPGNVVIDIKTNTGNIDLGNNTEKSPTADLSNTLIKPDRKKTDFQKKELPEKQPVASIVKNEKTATIAAIITSVVLITFITIMLLKLFVPDFGAGKKGQAEVPAFVGLDVETVEKNINKKKFKISVVEENSVDYEEGIIIAQEPNAGDVIDTPAEITLTVSSGAKSLGLKSYVNMESVMAQAELKRLNLRYKEVMEYSNNPEGFVIKQMPPAGETVHEGDEITLFVSRGQEIKKVTMPNLIGMEESLAKRELLSQNLAVGNITTETSTYPKGTVVFQSVAADSEVDQNTPVSLIISSGPSSAPEKIKYLNISLPQDKDSVALRVLVDGKQVHKATHKKDEKSVDVKITGTGTVKVDIYIDDKLHKSENIDM